MATLTHTEFRVDDADGGAPDRLFTFDTVVRGDKYQVKVGWEGSGPSIVTLSKDNWEQSIPPSDARVKATGTLTLRWDNEESQVIILFTGKLITNHSASMTDVCVGAAD